MKIFICHSSNFDFMEELYKPLRNSRLNEKHEVYLPQEKGYEVITDGMIRRSDLVIAEVSRPSIGQGIELGWAYVFRVPVVAVYREDLGLASKSVHKITSNVFPYKDHKDMVEKLENYIATFYPEGSV